jgi:hypothetical protein
MIDALGRYGLLLIVGLSFASCTTKTGPEENLALIYIENGSPTAIQRILVSECGATTWGVNRMAAGEVFQPNTIRAVAVTPGCWRARVETLDGRFAERNAGDLARGATFTWTLSSMQ